MAVPQIAITTGDRQGANIGSTLTTTLKVRCTDANGDPYTGFPVTFLFFAVPQGAAGHGLVYQAQAPAQVVYQNTDLSGYIEVTLILGDTPGLYTVLANAQGLPIDTVYFYETATPLNAIVTLAQVKDYLGKSDTDYSQDVFLQDLINLKSGQIEDFTEGPVVVQNFTDQIYDGSGKSHIYLRQWPATELLTPSEADVQYRNDPTQAWANLETDKRYILIKPAKSNSLFLYRSVFPAGHSNIKLSFKAGFDPVPQELVMVCLEEVAIAYKESNKSGEARLGQTSRTISEGGGTHTVGYNDLQERHKKILVPYMRISA